MQGIYVHIPFCDTKCGYCDFHSVVADGYFVGNYIKAFQQEVAYYGRKYKNKAFDTLFFGGGTPTILSTTQLHEMITVIFDNFNFSSNLEFTMEANPCSLPAKIQELASFGVNRISLGAQALQNDLLRKLGRNHSVDDIFAAVKGLQESGITNFNLDLMYGLPCQTIQDWEESLTMAIDINPTHFSCYSLIVEEDTPFYDLLEKDQLNLPDEEQEYAMFQLTKHKLNQAGYQQYEISNFAQDQKFQSRHNMIYWRNQSYLGLGSGAHGYMDRQRYANTIDLKQYINSWREDIPAIASIEIITTDQAMDETMMLGLRLLEGVEEAEFEKVFMQTLDEVYGDELSRLLEQGLVIREHGRLKLTDVGVTLGNLVFSAFIR